MNERVTPANFRSQRAVEKIGGVRTGRRADSSGRMSLVFEIAAADWRALELKRGS